MNFLADQAITSEDQDKLGRSNFAKHIAKGILKWQSKEPLCLGLYGEWGSGKTSIINLCDESIKEQTKDLKPEEKPIVFRFNPWIISGQEQLIRSFLLQFGIVLGRPDHAASAHNAAKIVEGLENFLGLLSYVPATSEIVKGAKEAIGNFRIATLALSKRLEGDLFATKKMISDELFQLDSPVVVIIDDIDRLNKQEIIQVFQLVKAVADFDNVIYLLAFDRAQVENCLAEIHKDFKYKYIDKIIQVGFDVPVPGRNKIRGFLHENLERLIDFESLDEGEKHRFNNAVHGPLPLLFKNIREVKKYLNYIKFFAPILENEVSMLDVLIMGAIHQFDPELYNLLIANKEVLVSDNIRAYVDSERDNTILKEIIKKSTQKYDEVIKDLLNFLFPRIQKITESMEYGNKTIAVCYKNKRICKEDYFDYFIELTAPEEWVPSREALDIVKNTDILENLTNKIIAYMQSGLIGKLFSRIIDDYSETLSNQKIETLITSLIIAEEELSHINPKLKFYSFRDDWSDVSYNLLKIIKPEERKNTLLNAMFKANKAIVLPLFFNNMIWREWNPRNDKNINEGIISSNRLLSRSETEEIKALILNKIQAFAKNDYFVNNWFLPHILYRWREWTNNPDEVESWLENIISIEKNNLNILRSFSDLDETNANYYRNPSLSLKVKMDELGKFFDTKKIAETCNRLLKEKPDWLDKEDESLINNFLDQYNEGTKRKGLQVDSKGITNFKGEILDVSEEKSLPLKG